MNGAQATRQIAEFVPTARVVGTSHNDSHTIQQALLDAGAVSFLSKRSSMDDMVFAIRKAAGRS
jgi:DNA-binding NarL/FixJ family response regulator